MTNLVIGDQMGMATLESCAEADALAPNAPSVVPRARAASAFYANQFARPNLPIPQVDDKMLGERKEPKQAKSAAPRQCASWCGLPQKDERVETRFAFFAVKEPTIEDAAYCCPQRPEDVGL